MRRKFSGTFVIGATIMSFTFGTPKYVTVEVPSSFVEVENGKSVLFFIRLAPADGIHINVEPSVSVNSETHGASFKVAGVKASGEYLDSEKPVAVECLAEGMTPGLHRAWILISYTYCSEKEQWCRMGNDSVSVELMVKE